MDMPVHAFDLSSHRLRIRRSALMVGAVALAAAAVPSVLASRADRAEVRATATTDVLAPSAEVPSGPPAPAAAAAPAIAAAAAVPAAVAAASTAPADAALPPAQAAAAVACRNSSDPSCGPLAWSPAPGANQPLSIAVSVSPALPKAGELVTVTVVAADPDAVVTTNGGSYFFADPHSQEAQIGFPAMVDAGVARYGQWTPPSPQPGGIELSFAHTFSQAGTFDFTFAALSGDEGDPGNVERNPYASRGSTKVPITVLPAA